MTNRVWRVDSAHGPLALRQGRPHAPLLGIDRCREWHVLQRLRGHHIGPEVQRFDARQDRAAFTWIPGTPGAPEPGAAQALLHRLHALPLCGYRFSPAELIERYRDLLGASLPPGIAHLSQACQQISLALETDAPLRLCHNDCVAKNWIRTGSGALRLIDCEFAGDNDPAFDLATLSLDVDLGPLPPRVAAYRPIVDCLWLLYCLVLAAVDPEQQEAARRQAAGRLQRLRQEAAP